MSESHPTGIKGSAHKSQKYWIFQLSPTTITQKFNLNKKIKLVSMSAHKSITQ